MENDVRDDIYPRARQTDLVVTALDDEILIQDTAVHEAHGLNAVASCIWKHCDGKSTIPQITERVGAALGEPVDESAIWYALSVFQRKNLLAEKVVTKETRMSRKKAVTKLGVAAGLAAVASITIPEAMAHASVCLTKNTHCLPGGTGVLACCGGCVCTPTSVASACVGSCV